MSISRRGQIAGARVPAATMLDLLADPELLKRAKAQFAQDTGETKYFSMLPPTARPPVDMNREIMEKFRPEMTKHYLNRKPVFR